MFVLSEFTDTVSVLPSNLALPAREAVVSQINLKYSGKVFHNVGLCIKLFDLIDVGESLVQHSTGSVAIKVRFRLIVFRPFEGEVILAQIVASTPNHIQLGLGFFNEIYVHPKSLPAPSYYNNEGVWVWEFNGGEMFYDIGETVRVVARHLRFRQVRPEDAKNAKDEAPKNEKSVENDSSVDVAAESPLTIFADMSLPGLGPVSWWPPEKPHTEDTSKNVCDEEQPYECGTEMLDGQMEIEKPVEIQ